MSKSESSQWQRNDKKPKNFQCPCGKTYLSNPALYTHIRAAHGGKAPGEIRRPDPHGRGRPKTSGTKIQQHNKLIEEAIKSDPFSELIDLLSTAEVSKNRQVKQIYENEPVFKLIMNDKDKPFSPPYLKEDRVFDVKMGEGIVQFFKEIEEKIQNKNAYDEIVMLIVLLTEHIIEETEDQNVLTLGTVGLMPEFVNYFIIHDFKKPVERLKLENLWIFQDQNSIKVFNLFFKWMLFKKYTLTKVEINEKYLNPNFNDSEDDRQKNQNEGSENEESQEEINDGESNEQDQQSENNDRNSHENNQNDDLKDYDEEQAEQMPFKKIKESEENC